MKDLVSTLLIFISSYAFCQINVDSIRIQLLESGAYDKVEAADITNGFYRYTNKNNLETFDICLDSLNNLSQYINVSIIHKTYDLKGRLLKLVGYDLKGEYALYDSSPILIKSYYNDTTIEAYYNYKEVQTGKKVVIIDSLRREIEVIWYGRENVFESRKLFEYSKANDSLYIKHMYENDNFNPNNKGVAIELRLFDPKNLDNIIEEWFYDSKLNLIDADHNNLSPVNNYFNYSHIKTIIKDGYTYKYFYNSKGELICESDGLSIYH